MLRNDGYPRDPWAARLLLSATLLWGGCHRAPQASAPRSPATTLSLDLRARAIEYKRVGDDIRAEQYFVAALEVGASVDEVLPELLSVCVRSQRYSAALQHAEEYLPLAHSPDSLQLLVASLYLAIGEVSKAQAVLEELASAKNDAKVQLLLGDLYAEELKDYARADDAYRAYVTLEPEGPRAAQLRKQLHRRLGAAVGGVSSRPVHVETTP